MSPRLVRTLAAVAALAFAVPSNAGATSVSPGAYVSNNPAGVATPCFVDAASPSLRADGLQCTSAAQVQAVITASCNGNYNYNYSQPTHASDSIYGSASSPGATYIYLECRVRKHPPNSTAWQTLHTFTAQTNGASVNGSSFTYLPPPPVDVPENLCVYAYANNAGTYTTC